MLGIYEFTLFTQSSQVTNKMKDLPGKIKQLRKTKGWSQKDLARKCGVSPRTAENWEQGRTNLSGSALVVVKGLLGLG